MSNNSQLLCYSHENGYTFYLLNQQEGTWYKVTDAGCVEMLMHLYMLRVHNEADLFERLAGLQEAKTLRQFGGSDPIEPVQEV